MRRSRDSAERCAGPPRRGAVLPRVRPTFGAALRELPAGQHRTAFRVSQRVWGHRDPWGHLGELPCFPLAGAAGRRPTGGTGWVWRSFSLPLLPPRKARSRPPPAAKFSPRSAAGGAPLPDRSRREVSGEGRSPPSRLQPSFPAESRGETVTSGIAGAGFEGRVNRNGLLEEMRCADLDIRVR